MTSLLHPGPPDSIPAPEPFPIPRRGGTGALAHPSAAFALVSAVASKSEAFRAMKFVYLCGGRRRVGVP